MMIKNRQKRRDSFSEFKHNYENGLYDYLTIKEADVIQPPVIGSKKANKGNCKFIHGNVVEYMITSKNAAVLVFCSLSNPGGGVANGSSAQEEDISQVSSWYFQVKDSYDFYDESGLVSCINTDSLLYADGFILRDNWLNYIEPRPISFIGSTAINLSGLKDQDMQISEKEYISITKKRIETIFSLAEEKNKSELILGAYGCGVFGGNASIVSSLYKEVYDSGLFSGDISLVISDGEVLKIFENSFA